MTKLQLLGTIFFTLFTIIFKNDILYRVSQFNYNLELNGRFNKLHMEDKEHLLSQPLIKYDEYLAKRYQK